jgi:drug/metabolite transporter (DMT)-like permease
VSPAVVALALGAAVLHASWNAFLRTGADRLWTASVMAAVMGLIAMPFAVVLPAPAAGAWPYLLGSVGLQVAHTVSLVAAYRHGELGQIYPIVRGTAPLLVTVGGIIVLGERISGPGLLGVLLIAAGILALTLGRTRPPVSSVGFAILTGVIIAGYVLVDAQGVRVLGDPLAYAAWISLLYGPLLLAVVSVMRKELLQVDLRSLETAKAAGGGVVSLAAYVAVIAALEIGPTGPVAALRETSVIFAALIGGLFLQERLTARKMSACIIVALGAVCLR